MLPKRPPAVGRHDMSTDVSPGRTHTGIIRAPAAPGPRPPPRPPPPRPRRAFALLRHRPGNDVDTGQTRQRTKTDHHREADEHDRVKRINTKMRDISSFRQTLTTGHFMTSGEMVKFFKTPVLWAKHDRPSKTGDIV